MASFLKKFMKEQYFKKRKPKDETQLLFLKRLYRLLNNGYSLLAALDVMKWDEKLRPFVLVVEDELKKGFPLDNALEKNDFHSAIVAYLYFVRVNGNLLSSLRKCLLMFEQRMTYTRKFIRVIRYPLMLSLTFIILLVFVQQSVLPSFLELFHSNQASSRTVLYTMLFIDFLSKTAIGLIALSAVGAIVWNYFKTRLSLEKQIEFYRRIPLWRTFLKKQTSYYFSIHMSMFLKAGLPMNNTLENMSKQEKLPIVSHYAAKMKEQLSNGFHISHLLAELPFIEAQLSNLFQKNTNANDLAKDLATYADFLAEEMENKMMRIIALIQPVFFIILACFIILVYMALMWPMFQLIQSV